MNKFVPALCLTGLIALTGLMSGAPAARALPQMEITAAKATLTKRTATPVGTEFTLRRVTDRPSFDNLGIGNYFTEYRLDAGQKVQVWMYVESAPPVVDEVVVYIYPAKAKDLTFDRALKLLNIVYGTSASGSKVVQDFKDAKSGKEFTNQYGKKETKTYQQGSLLPASHNGGLYYIGKSFAYKVSLHKGGLEVGIYRKDFIQKYVLDIKKRLFPDQAPAPKATPTPRPPASPRPKIVW